MKTTKDRYVVEDGVCVIRPLNYEGKPTLTQKERDAVVDHWEPILKALFAARRHEQGYQK